MFNKITGYFTTFMKLFNSEAFSYFPYFSHEQVLEEINKLPVQERLFRIRLKADPYCLYCVGAEIGDAVHYFCTCNKTSETWSWVKRQVITQVGRDVLDWDVLNLFFPKSRRDKEMVWMLTHYVLYVWNSLYVKESDVKLDQFIGYLKFKFKEASIKLNDLQIFL